MSRATGPSIAHERSWRSRPPSSAVHRRCIWLGVCVSCGLLMLTVFARPRGGVAVVVAAADLGEGVSDLMKWRAKHIDSATGEGFTTDQDLG